MKKSLKVILSLVCVLALAASMSAGVFASGEPARPAASGEAAPTLEEVYSLAQRALDVQAVENIMNRHVLYHCYGEHIAEMEEIWVQDPVNQATASFGQNQGYYVGYDAIYEAYATGHWNNWTNAAKRYCQQNGIDTTGMSDYEITNIYGGVGQLLLHVTTTAIIEVAEDGKTAKGYWYSPGMIAETGMAGNSIWEAYGADFVKENGEWKMWHLHMYTDFMCQFGDNFTTGKSGGGSGEPSGGQGGQINYQGEQGAAELALSALEKGDYLYLKQYEQFSTNRLRSEMEVVPIPMPYESWDFSVPNYGPAPEQLARYGLNVNDWYAVYGS